MAASSRIFSQRALLSARLASLELLGSCWSRANCTSRLRPLGFGQSHELLPGAARDRPIRCARLGRAAARFFAAGVSERLSQWRGRPCSRPSSFSSISFWLSSARTRRTGFDTGFIRRLRNRQIEGTGLLPLQLEVLHESKEVWRAAVRSSNLKTVSLACVLIKINVLQACDGFDGKRVRSFDSAVNPQGASHTSQTV